MKQRFGMLFVFSFALILTVTGCLVIFNMDKDEASNSSDEVSVSLAATNFASGNGTASNPYIIDSFTALNGSGSSQFRGHVAANVGSSSAIYYKLGANINLQETSSSATWTPIPRFGPNLVLDGYGYTISNLNITSTSVAQGFFANFQGTIKNVNFVNANITGTNNSTSSSTTGVLRGIVAATVDRTSTSGAESTINATIENVHILSGSVNGTRAGGLVGAVGVTTTNANRTTHSSANLTLNIIDSSNNATVSSSMTSVSAHTITGNGGLIGHVYKSAINITGSFNSGTVMMQSSAISVGIGGLIGMVYDTTNSNTAKIILSASYNTGKISFAKTSDRILSITTTAQGNTYGGARYASTGAARQAAGGLIGVLYSSNTGSAYRINLSVNACYNTGLVQLIAYRSGNPSFNANNNIYAVGGLIGIMEGVGTSGNTATITNSYNSGELRILTYTGNLHLIVAGIAARVYYSYLNIISCYNSGQIYGNGYTGGSVNMAGIVAPAPVSSNSNNSQNSANNQSTINISNSANIGTLSGNGVEPNSNGVGFNAQGIAPSSGVNVDQDTCSSTTGYGPGSPGTNGTVVNEDAQNIVNSITQTVNSYFSYTVTPPTIDIAGSYTFATNHIDNLVSRDAPFTFTLTFADAYNLSPTLSGFGISIVGENATVPLNFANDALPEGAGLTDGYMEHVSGNTWSFTTPAITEDKTIVVSGVELNSYVVNYPEASNFTFEGTPQDTVNHGSLLSFAINMAPGYDQTAPSVTVGGTSVSGVRHETFANRFTYTMSSVARSVADASGDIAVVIGAATLNTYDVNLSSGTGYSLVGDSTATYGESYSFTFGLEPGYKKSEDLSIVVTIGGETFETLNKTAVDALDNGVYTIPAINVTGDISVNVTGVVLDSYSVSLDSGTGYTLTGSASANYGQAYNFNFSVNQGYMMTGEFADHVVVTVDGVDITSHVTNSGTTYTIPANRVTGDIEITVDGIVVNNFSVTLPELSTQIGYTLTGDFGDTAAVFGQPYVFNYSVATGYIGSISNISISINGSTISNSVLGVSGVEYTIPSSYVTGDIIIAVSPLTARTYTVSLPSSQVGYVLLPVGGTTATHDVDYKFNFKKLTGYDACTPLISVKVGDGTSFTPTSTKTSGVVTYTIDGAVILGNIVVSVSGVIGNDLSVSFLPTEQSGYTIETVNTVPRYGSPYSFRFELSEGYTNSTPTISIKVGGSPVATPTPLNGVYTIPASSVNGNIEITVDDVVLNTYSVSLSSGDEYTLDGDVGPDAATFGAPYKFSFVLDPGYSTSNPDILVYIGGSLWTTLSKASFDINDEYTILGEYVDGDIAVYVDGIAANVYSVNLSSGAGYKIRNSANTANAATSATYGTDYVFSIVMDTGWTDSYDKYVVSVKYLNNSNVEYVKSGNIFTISGEDITGVISISVTNVTRNTLAVDYSKTQNGYELDGEQTTSYGLNYIFTFELVEGWTKSNYSIVVKVGDNNVLAEGTHYNVNNGVYTVLAANVTDKITITVNGVVRDTLTVNLPNAQSQVGYSLSGNTQTSYGLDYTFNFALDSGYNESNADIIVTVGGEQISTLTDNGSGVYKIPAASVNGNIVITVLNVEGNELSVLFKPDTQTGYTLTGNSTVRYGSEYSFNFALKTGYTDSEPEITVMVGGAPVTPTVNGSLYKISASSVTGNIVITVVSSSVVPNKFNVAHSSGTGYILGGNKGDDAATFGVDYTFTFELLSGYTKSTPAITVTVNGVGYSPIISGNTYKILGASVNGAISVVISGVNPDTYNVSVPVHADGGYTVKNAAGTASAGSSATYGVDYKFIVDLADGYTDSTPAVTVTIGGSPYVLGNAVAGVYTIAGTAILGNIVISINNNSITHNTYDVSDVDITKLGGFSISAVGVNAATHGTDFKFSISLHTGYTQSIPAVSVTIGGKSYEIGEGIAGVYTISGAAILGDIVIVVDDVVLNKYSVTVTSTDYGVMSIETQLDEGKAVHGTNVYFEITPEAHYYVVGLVINGSHTPYSLNVYTLTNVTQPITIYPVFKEETKYKVTFYNKDGAAIYVEENYAGELIIGPDAGTMPHRSGYQITDWSTKVNGGGIVYSLDLLSSEDNQALILGTSNIELYPVWGTYLEYTITTQKVGDYTAGTTFGTMSIGKTYYLSAVAFTTVADSAYWYVKDPSSEDAWVKLSIIGRNVNIVGLFTEEFLSLYEIQDGSGWKVVFKHEILEEPKTQSVTASVTGNAFGQVSYVVGTGSSTIFTRGTSAEIIKETASITITAVPYDFYRIETIALKIKNGNLWDDVGDVWQDGVGGAKYCEILNIEDDYLVEVTFSEKLYQVVLNMELESGESLDGNYIKGFAKDTPTYVSYGDTLALSLDNELLAADNLTLQNYMILNNAEYMDVLEDTIGVYTCVVDKTFLNTYSNNSIITLTIQFIEKRSIEVTIAAGDVLNGTVYAEWFDETYGMYRKLEAKTLPFDTLVKITITARKGYDINWNLIEDTLEDSGVAYEISYSNRTIVLNLTEKLELEVSLNADFYTIIVQLRDTDGNYRGITDEVYSNILVGNEPIISGYVLPKIEYFKFSKWYIVVNGVKVLEITEDNYGMILNPLGIDSFTLTPELIAFIGQVNNNEIYILGEYAIETRLNVTVSVNGSQNLDGNSYTITIDGQEETIDSAEVLRYGAAVVIEAKPVSVHYSFVGFFDESGTQITDGVTGNKISFVMEYGRQIKLIFEPVKYDIAALNFENGNGVIEVIVNGVTYSDLTEAQRKIKVGDTIVVKFMSNDGYQLKSLTMTNGSKTATIKNGQVIYVTSAWLAEWLSNGKLNVDVKAETQMATMVIVGIGGASVIVPLAIILSIVFIIAIKRKKKDYLVALEKSKQSAARLQASQVMSDIMKEAKGEQ